LEGQAIQWSKDKYKWWSTKNSKKTKDSTNNYYIVLHRVHKILIRMSNIRITIKICFLSKLSDVLYH